MAQRLVRKLCKHCSVVYEPSGEELEQVELILPEAGSLTWRRGKGCPKCKNRGFSGRVAVGELFAVNNEARNAIELREPESVIQSLAVLSGMKRLMTDFVDKVSAGETAISEIWSVVVGEEVTSGICPHCGMRVEQSYIACPSCGFTLKDKCPECGRVLEKSWRFCPSCQKDRYLAKEVPSLTALGS
jgi:rRNA maturation protein Nop10